MQAVDIVPDQHAGPRLGGAVVPSHVGLERCAVFRAQIDLACLNRQGALPAIPVSPGGAATATAPPLGIAQLVQRHSWRWAAGLADL